MYPIAVVLVLATAVSIERFVFLRKAEQGNSELWARLTPLLSSGRLAEAESMVGGSDTAVARILSSGFAQMKRDGRRSELENVTDDELMEVLPAIERRTHYLATFSNMSTLLGLLGTVIGLIGAFAALGTADPVEKAELLSAGISEAMSCTAFGLMVAIPSLFAHAYLQSRAASLVEGLESVSARFVRAASGGSLAVS
jgi:biopolymer transport protein ExbB